MTLVYFLRQFFNQNVAKINQTKSWDGMHLIAIMKFYI